ncbi:MAG: histidine phosphatase family protein [Bacteroidales bacterium]|nr:histidine phosphatase family protein [Bacteroidales bacterium]
MLLYIVRHGETVDNLRGVIQGHLPGKLTETGILQAKKLGERLKDVKFDLVFSSDLHRAVQTTHEIIGFHKHVPVDYTQELREIKMGENQGKTREELRYNQDFSGVYVTPKGGESTEQLYDRVMGFLIKISSKNNAEKILLVSHGGTIKAFISIFTGVQKSLIFSVEHIKNTSLTVVELDSELNGKVLIKNDIAHLIEN